MLAISPEARSAVAALCIKRAGDLVVSSMMLALLLPVFSIVALMIAIDSPGPVFFRQRRLGRDGHQFRIVKFRTMVEGAERRERFDSEGATIQAANDPRVTFVGRALRATSIDELPQLWNVFKGEMSIVGPRPDLAASISLYTASMRRKLKMRPGITGLAIVRGRNSIPWSVRVAWDIKYVETWSLMLDLRILVATAGVVLTRRGVFNATPESGSEFPL